MRDKGLDKVLNEFSDYVDKDFSIDQWTNIKENIILKSDNEDYALFELLSPRIYEGHFMFACARGKEALKLSNNFIEILFRKYNAKLLIGLVPIDNRKTKIFTRKLKFNSLGEIDTVKGSCEFFYKTDEGY